MVESSACVPSSTSLPNEDSNMDASSLETLITGAWDRAVHHLSSLCVSSECAMSLSNRIKVEGDLLITLDGIVELVHVGGLNEQTLKDVVLQGLKESQSELLSRVQKLKEEWQVDVDLQMKSCDQEIEGFTYAHNAEVERLRMELQSRANALKEQLSTLQQNWQLEVAALTSPTTNISAVPSKR